MSKPSYRQDNGHFCFYNANPKNKLSAGDCVVRAISFASELDWDTVYTGLCEIGMKMKMMPNDRKVFDKYLDEIGFIKMKTPKDAYGLRSVLFGDSQWVTDTQKLHTTETRMKCMLIFIKRLVIQKFQEKNLIWKRGD